jgi:hypothetical protein
VSSTGYILNIVDPETPAGDRPFYLIGPFTGLKTAADWAFVHEDALGLAWQAVTARDPTRMRVMRPEIFLMPHALPR